jgi:hypothetical protein
MKNIYNEKTGYHRVSDEVAEQKVRSGTHRYASKSEAKGKEPVKTEEK